MIFAAVLLVVGIFLSAFFSGAETGFYRATRTRLMLDAMDGDWIARGLLWLTNHPSMFVATVLVGNNLANYLVSLAVVRGVAELATGQQFLLELLGPLLLSPVVFVYGEAVPKSIFFDRPNRLLRRCGPALLVCTWLFVPLTSALWAISKLLEMLVGQSPQQLRLVLARRELEQVLVEGHEAGILRPAQRTLAQGLFALAGRPVTAFATPATRMVCANAAMSKGEILRLARRHRVPVLPIVDADQKRQPIGYLRVVDLYLDDTEQVPSPRPLVELTHQETHIQSLFKLQRKEESLGRIIGQDGQTVGYVTLRQLTKALFRSPGS